MNLDEFTRRYRAWIANFISDRLRIYLMRCTFGSLGKPLHLDGNEFLPSRAADALMCLELLENEEFLMMLKQEALIAKAQLIEALSGRWPSCLSESDHRRCMMAVQHLIRAKFIPEPQLPLSSQEKALLLPGFRKQPKS